jgi:hypothetical protein
MHTLAPAVMGTTTVPVKSVRFSAGVIANPNRHSGMRHPHIVLVPGAVPRFTITMPFGPAYDVLGLGLKVLSAFEVYAAKFANYEISTDSVHTKWSLAASAAVAAIITGASVDLDGDLMAEVECWPIGAPTGHTHPITSSDSNALPSFASQPTLYTLGPMSINGTVRTGLMSHGFSRNVDVQARRTDGSKFATTAGRLSTDTRMTGEHGDPVTLLGALGLLGTHLTSNLVQYFYRYDPTSGEVITTAGTGLSITAAAGRITPTELDLGDGAAARTGFEAICLSDDTDEPLVVSTSASVPALS